LIISIEILTYYSDLGSQNRLQSLPEETRIEEIRQLGEIVLPDTADTGQANIRLQINNSVQEFEALRAAIM